MKNKRSDAGSFALGTSLFPVFALVLLMAHVNGAQAQTQSYLPVVVTPPIVNAIDENFVSVFTGQTQFTIPAIQLGDVSFVPFSAGPYFQAGGAIEDKNYGSLVGCLQVSPTGVVGAGGFVGTSVCATTASASLQAIYGQERATFVLNSGAYFSYDTASTFVDNVSVNGTCTWTQRDGTQIIYYAYHATGTPVCQSNNIYQVIHPDGRIATYYYYGTLSTQGFSPSPLLSIATNRGYLLKYNYSGTPTFGGETSVTAINRAFETCNPAAISCSLAASWPTATLTFQNKPVTVSDGFSSLGPTYNPNLHYIFTIRDAANRSHVFELDSYSRVISYQPPQATTPVYSYSLCTLMSGNKTLTNCFGLTTWDLTRPNDFTLYSEPPLLWDSVSTVTRIGNVWNYNSGFTQGTMTPPDPTQIPSEWGHSANSPLGVFWSAYGNSTPGTESKVGPTDQVVLYDGTTYQYERNTRNNVYSEQTKTGILTQEGYDGRGNLQGTTQTPNQNPIAGTWVPPLTQSAVYPSTCTNIVTCNEPTSAKDANGNPSSFSYDPAHGGALTVTGPAVNGIQPQTRKTYVQRFAWYYNSSGVMTRETHPIWLLATESYCISGAASGSSTFGSECVKPNDEVDVTYQYGADSGPNTLLLLGKAVTTGGATRQTCYGYDPQGDKIWETSPNANLASCTAGTPPAPYLTGYTYLPGGLLTGTISPAPSGQSNFAANRNTYDANERLQTVETGVLASWPSNGTPASAWAGFNATTTTRFTYDAYGNKGLETLEGSDHVITHVTQYAYDTYNRLTCTAVRMNPPAFGSLPASACTLGAQGSNGPDRITQNFYDSLNRVTVIQRAVGTSLVENYRTNTYTTDSLLQSVSDANGNQSYFIYDGLDRMLYAYFPSPTSTGSNNPADYEQYGYDPNGNRTSLRKRDGQPISYSYDALNRMSTKTEPVASQSVTYAYDLRGLQTSAVFTSSGKGITNSYDGFGRRLSTTNTMGTTSLQVSRQYDLDGDLIRVTHPDTSYFQYTYDGDDRFTGISENGATSIVSQSYFPNGLRSAQSRGGVTTSYGYQPNTLLASMQDALAGTGPVTTTFAYNPANQLTSRMRTNDAYAFTGTPFGTTVYSVNGLNQYTNVGGTGFGYNDGRANLTSDGATTYSYDAENHLLTASGAHNATLTYDPLGRLYQIASGSTTTQFLYDGDALVAEYDGSGALLQRYVHGPQVDDPWIWYQGATVSSTSRRSLQVDHQGSIVSLADASATALTINAYDEYGAPAAGNAGRFQYTGQAWMPELGLYYYKARVYDPRLGRFLQTDPVGYTDDLNLYAYVYNDPLNKADPSGNAGELVAVGCGVTAEIGCAPGAAVGAIIEGVIYVGSAAVAAYGIYKAGQLLNEKKPEVNPDKQGKHQPDHPNFQPGKSELDHPDPQGLVDKGAGTGQQVGDTPVGEAGSKERVDFGEPIGTHVDPQTGERKETSVGIIHYGKKDVHIVPARPPEPPPLKCEGASVC